MKYLHVCVILISLLLTASSHASSNETSRNDPSWWINLGFGAGAVYSHTLDETSAQRAYNISLNNTITPNTFITVSKNYTGTHSIWEVEADNIGLLYGYIKRNPTWYWSASAGISYYKLENHRLALRAIKSTGAGLPIEIQAFWTPFNHFGIGFIGHAVASKNPFATALFGIQFF